MRWTRVQRSLAGLVVGLSAIFAPTTARAFGPPQCTPGTVVPFPFRMIYGGSRHWTLPNDVNAATQVTPNNTAYFHSVIANPAVREVTFHFTSFDTELNYDRLQFGVLPAINLSGPLGAMNQAVANDHVAPAPWGATLNYTTDGSNPSSGFEIDTATISGCNAVPNGTASQTPVEIGDGTRGAGRRAIGILLGTGDTVYYSYLSNARNQVPGNFKLHAALNTEVPGVDFNLYARCGAIPTATTFDFARRSPGPQEFLEVETGPCPTTWYFAIDSASGAGSFEFNVATGSDVAVCASFGSPDFSTEEKDLARDKLVGTLKTIYGATAGAVLVSRIQVTNDGVCDPSILPQPYRFLNVHIKKDCAGSETNRPGLGAPDVARLCTDWLAETGAGLAFITNHEVMHLIFGLPDEYTASGAGCGHSMMARRDTTFFSLCTARNHGLDPTIGVTYVDPGEASMKSTAPFGDSASMWAKLEFNQYGPPLDMPRMQQINSPDNYDYLDFDFNSSVSGTVQVISSY